MMTNVAIVEADRPLRNNLEWLINETDGFRCICACGAGEEAMRRLPKLKPQIAIMGSSFRGMPWSECIWKLKVLVPKLRVIILTACEDTDHILHALRAGASGYVLKHSGPESILAAIRNARDGGAPMYPRVTRRVFDSVHQPDSSERHATRLTARESEILAVLAQGFSNKAIADRMSLTVPTVRTHLMHIYEKLHVRSRTEAVIRCLQ